MNKMAKMNSNNNTKTTNNRLAPYYSNH